MFDVRASLYQEVWRHVGLFDIRASHLQEAWRHVGLCAIRSSLVPGRMASCGVVCHLGQPFTWEPDSMCGCVPLGPAFYLEAWRHVGFFTIRASLLPGSLAACVRTARQATRWQQLHLLLIVLFLKLYSEIYLSHKRPSHNPLLINYYYYYSTGLQMLKMLKEFKTFTLTLR